MGTPRVRQRRRLRIAASRLHLARDGWSSARRGLIAAGRVVLLLPLRCRRGVSDSDRWRTVAMRRKARRFIAVHHHRHRLLTIASRIEAGRGIR